MATYWAKALSTQESDPELAAKFSELATGLTNNELKIVEELNFVQGVTMDVGGYYKPDPEKAAIAMRPSSTFNELLAKI